MTGSLVREQVVRTAVIALSVVVLLFELIIMMIGGFDYLVLGVGLCEEGWMPGGMVFFAGLVAGVLHLIALGLMVEFICHRIIVVFVVIESILTVWIPVLGPLVAAISAVTLVFLLRRIVRMAFELVKRGYQKDEAWLIAN